jgi:hypothetical protein
MRLQPWLLAMIGRLSSSPTTLGYLMQAEKNGFDALPGKATVRTDLELQPHSSTSVVEVICYPVAQSYDALAASVPSPSIHVKCCLPVQAQCDRRARFDWQ